MRSRAAGTLAFLLFIYAGALFAAQDQPLQRKLAALEKLPPKFSFVVIGDNRAGDPACDVVYQKVIAAALERKPDLIVNTGDQIDKPGNIEHWKRFWDLSKNVTMPYFFTVGNHDAHVEVAESEETYKAQVELPRNELYYSFVVGSALFIVLDSYIKGEDKRITGGQFTWLEGMLAASKQKHKFIFVHHPLYPEAGRGKHHGNSLDRYKDERDRLQSLFVKHKVTTVFLGHEHLYLRKTVDGIPHIIAGGGGAPLYAKDEDGGFHHYVLVTVDGDRVAGEVVDVNGKVRDRYAITPVSREMDDSFTVSEDIALLRQGRYKEALQVQDKALKVEPCNPGIWINRAVVLIDMDRHNEGLMAAQQALDCNANDNIAIRIKASVNKADALNRLQRHAEALSTLDSAVSSIDRTDDVLLNTVVDGEMMLRDVLAVAWINKGVAYKGLNRIDDAIKCLNTALKIRPNVAEAYYNRACYRLLQGQKKAAIADLGKALELKPALKKYAVLDEDFIKIRDDRHFKKLVE